MEGKWYETETWIYTKKYPRNGEYIDKYRGKYKVYDLLHFSFFKNINEWIQNNKNVSKGP